MYSFPVSLLPFLGVINLFGDVIITVINGYICPNANVTVHIQSTVIPKWQVPQFRGSSCHPCRGFAAVPQMDTNQITFYSNTDKEITRIEAIQFLNPQYSPYRYHCQSRSIRSYLVLDHMKLVFRMSSNYSVNDQLIGINVPWVWSRSLSILPQISIQKSKLRLNMEQNADYPIHVESPNRAYCTSKLTYNITIEHDCPPLRETTELITTTVTSTLTHTQTTVNAVKANEEAIKTKSYLTTTKIPKEKANNKKIEKPTKKKIDPRLINCLAVSGSAIIIVIVVSLVMYFGWYKRKLNQLGLLPQNATPAQN